MLGLGGLDFSMRCKAVRSKTNNLLYTYSSMKQAKKGELAGRKQLCTVLRVGVDSLDSPFSVLRCGLPFPNDATTADERRRCLLPTTTVSEYFFNFKSWWLHISLLPGFWVDWGLSYGIGPLGRTGLAATLGQKCPKMTQKSDASRQQIAFKPTFQRKPFGYHNMAGLLRRRTPHCSFGFWLFRSLSSEDGRLGNNFCWPLCCDNRKETTKRKKTQKKN